MKNNLVYTLEKVTGSLCKYRLKIKSFKSFDDMHKWLNKQCDNKWQELTEGIRERHSYPDKRGTYAQAGGKWHNVKNLDPSILAHI